MKRRDFILSSGLGAAGLAIGGSSLLEFKPRHRHHIGVQLWSVREDVKKDAKGTLAKLASYGYKEVESGNYQDGKFYGFDAKTFRTMLDDAGLKMTSGHAAVLPTDLDSKMMISDRWKKAVENAKIVGQNYIINPWMNEPDRKTADSVKHLVDAYNKAAEYAHAQGLKFAYHNHNFEFNEVEGKKIYDYLLDGCDKNLVDFEMDIYWVVFANQNPIDWMEKHPGRFKLVHVKDMAKTEKRESIEVGNGSIDFNKIFEHKKTAGIEYYIVELEAYVTTPMQGVDLCLQNLKKLKF